MAIEYGPEQIEWEMKVKELAEANPDYGYARIAGITHQIFHPDLSLQAEKSRVRRYLNSHCRNNKNKIDDFDNIKLENKEVNIDEIIERKSTVEYASDGSMSFQKIIALTEGEPITPEAIMKAHNIDSKLWEVVNFKNNFWQAQAKGGKKIFLYQSKITVKPRIDSIDISELKEHFETFKPTIITAKVDKQNVNDNIMMEVNICDLHLGKLAWNGDTGEDYDYKIATQHFNKVIKSNIRKIKEYKPEKILFV